jgi:hypothetical protein
MRTIDFAEKKISPFDEDIQCGGYANRYLDGADMAHVALIQK